MTVVSTLGHLDTAQHLLTLLNRALLGRITFDNLEISINPESHLTPSPSRANSRLLNY